VAHNSFDAAAYFSQLDDAIAQHPAMCRMLSIAQHPAMCRMLSIAQIQRCAGCHRPNPAMRRPPRFSTSAPRRYQTDV